MDFFQKSELNDLIAKAVELQAEKTRQAALVAKRGFVNWQIKEAAENHSKGIYGWIKKATSGLQSEDFVHNGRILVDSRSASQARKEQWQALWQVTDGSSEQEEAYMRDLLSAWAELEEEKKKEVLEEMNIQQLHEAIFTFARLTGKGSDNTTPDLIKAMPLQGKFELLKLFNSIQARGAWPWQWLHVIIAQLAKPAGGERPIGLLPFLMRISFRMKREDTRAWAAVNQGKWDTAVLFPLRFERLC